MRIILEYANGGDLHNYIKDLKENNRKIPTEQLLIWFGEIGSAVQFCHEQNILHRDIKPKNIFIKDG